MAFVSLKEAMAISAYPKMIIDAGTDTLTIDDKVFNVTIGQGDVSPAISLSNDGELPIVCGEYLEEIKSLINEKTFWVSIKNSVANTGPIYDLEGLAYVGRYTWNSSNYNMMLGQYNIFFS